MIGVVWNIPLWPRWESVVVLDGYTPVEKEHTFRPGSISRLERWRRWKSSTIFPRDSNEHPSDQNKTSTDASPENQKLTADGKAGLAVSLPSLVVGVVGVGIALMTLILTRKRRGEEIGVGTIVNLQVNVLVAAV